MILDSQLNDCYCKKRDILITTEDYIFCTDCEGCWTMNLNLTDEELKNIIRRKKLNRIISL